MTTPPSLFSLPEVIADEAQLDDVLSRPRPPLVEFIRQVRSPLLILGAGGKMGPSLAVLAWRAAAAARHDLRVVAVSRFRNAAAREWLESRGVEAISCDLFKREALAGLPEAADILYLVGREVWHQPKSVTHLGGEHDHPHQRGRAFPRGAHRRAFNRQRVSDGSYRQWRCDGE